MDFTVQIIFHIPAFPTVKKHFFSFFSCLPGRVVKNKLLKQMAVGPDIFLCAHQLYLLCWETVLDETKMYFYIFYIIIMTK